MWGTRYYPYYFDYYRPEGYCDGCEEGNTTLPTVVQLEDSRYQGPGLVAVNVTMRVTLFASWNRNFEGNIAWGPTFRNLGAIVRQYKVVIPSYLSIALADLEAS